METSSYKRSKKPLFVMVGVVVALLIVGIAVVSTIGGDNGGQSVANEQAESSSAVASKEEVEQGIKAIEETAKRSTEDRTAAKEALEDEKKQIKVGG